jgi:hypothetical protein
VAASARPTKLFGDELDGLLDELTEELCSLSELPTGWELAEVGDIADLADGPSVRT